jgi:hypothetical protein
MLVDREDRIGPLNVLCSQLIRSRPVVSVSSISKGSDERAQQHVRADETSFLLPCVETSLSISLRARLRAHVGDNGFGERCRVIAQNLSF